MRTYITLSKSGHYTVSIRDGGKLLYRERKLASLTAAREAARKFQERDEKVWQLCSSDGTVLAEQDDNECWHDVS